MLGVLLLAASVCKMYVDLSDRVGMAIAARGLMQRAVAAKCDYYNPELDNQVVYLSDCETNIRADMIDAVREGLQDVAPGSVGSRIGKGYMICSKRKFRVDVKADNVPSNGSTPLIPTSQVLRECTDIAESEQSQLAQPICNEEQHDKDGNGAGKKASSAVRGVLQQNCLTVSVIALQTKHALLPMSMNGISFFMIEKGAVDVYNFAEKAQVHRPLPQQWTIILIFAGLFTMNLGFSEIPLYKLPVFCQFQHCSFALMATLAVMSTAIISGVVFGAAWTRYNIVLAVPMFVISLASFCLLGYVRCRCAAEDSDDEYERPVKDYSEGTESVVIDRR
jgi:hypothetical protein